MSRRRRVPGRHCTLAVTGLLSCLSPLTGSAETYSSLPPPPSAAASQQQQNYMLGLVVNGEERDQVVPVQFQNGHYLLRAADLQRAGFPTARITASIIDVSAMDQVQAEYDRQRQRILLTVPSEWLPKQTFGGAAHNGPRYPGRSSNGLLFNYDVYASQTTDGGTRMSAWNELRLFGNAGQFSSNGVYQQQLTGDSGYLQDGYLRYDTWWANQDEERALSWRVGDLITDSLAWSSSVRLGGIQIARDFSVRPDLVTYPLPSFSGQAAVPSTVDLFVNGYKTSSNSVQPGPYSLTNMPFVNGAGNAVVVTTDAQGRRVSTTLPFYVASDLLKSGLSDFSFSAGALRQNYGLKNFDYGSAAGSGSYRYGIADWLTLETHAEAAQSLALGGAGVQLKMGAWGVVNGAVTQSQMQGDSGRQYSWGYQYNTSRFSVGMQQTRRTTGFGNLALYGDRESGVATAETYTLSRSSAQYNASVALDRYGSLGAALIDITSGSGDRTRLLNLSWSKNLWGNTSLYLSASRDQQEGNWSGAVSLMIPFSDLSNASISMERDRQGGTAERLSVSRAMPTDGGIAYDASWANQSSGGSYRQGNLRWRNQQFETSAGFYGDDNYSTEFADLSGSLVLMDNSVFAANQVTDAFVLVKTDYPNVNVRYENQLMGKTNSDGYLLVPAISSYYPAKYDIDTLDLPADMAASSVEQRFSVKRQSGYLLHFPIEPLRAASVILHDSNGEPLPVSTVISREGQQSGYVGWDGITWMENLSEHNPPPRRNPGRTPLRYRTDGAGRAAKIPYHLRPAHLCALPVTDRKYPMKKLLLLCSFILLMGGSLPALAACTTAPVSAAFGGVSSFTVNTTASTVSAPGTINCGTGVLALLSSDSVTVQLVSATSSTGNRGTLRLSDTIPVQLCTDSACATELGIGGTIVTYSRSQLLGLSIGTGNQVVFSLPFFLRTVPGAVVAAGTYTVTLNVQVVYNVCTGVGIGGLCLLGSQNSGTTTLPLTATIAIANDCTTITSPAVNFGSAPLVSSFTGVSQSINVVCTKGSTYSVGMNNGIHAVGAQRYMASGTNLLAYEIYKGSGTASRWGGTVTAERMQSTAANSVSTDGLTRTFNYNAQVLTSQATPVAGSYSDTITVDLSF